MPEESDASSTSKLTVITDQDHHPVTVDHNPAHFDGFLAEIADFARRSGKFLELLEHGITFRGAKTVVDSVSAIPFIQGKVTGAKFYSADDPCPPTTQRIVDHNEAAAAAGSPQIVPYTRDPDDSNIIVNPFFIRSDDLALGNSIANCFEDSSYIERLRNSYGMGGRDIISQLRVLAAQAKPAQKTLVIRRFTRYAEAPVLNNIDENAFDKWYKQLGVLHRRIPLADRKSDAEICEYLNVLLYSQ